MVEGQGKNGPWFKQEYILEIPSQYPKKVCFSLWGTKIDEYNLHVGQKVTAHIDVESREYNGRWYSEIKAWKVEKLSGGSATTAPSRANEQRAADPVPPQFESSGNDDDLPF